jgi:hypothetical protein
MHGSRCESCSVAELFCVAIPVSCIKRESLSASDLAFISMLRGRASIKSNWPKSSSITHEVLARRLEIHSKECLLDAMLSRTPTCGPRKFARLSAGTKILRILKAISV